MYILKDEPRVAMLIAKSELQLLIKIVDDYCQHADQLNMDIEEDLLGGLIHAMEKLEHENPDS